MQLLDGLGVCFEFAERTTISRGGLLMKRTSFMLMLLLVLVTPLQGLAGPKDDVGAATQAWIDGMNSHKCGTSCCPL
jgi:hypothetical protein